MNRKTIRNSVGLPDDNGKIIGLVSDDPAELSENTIGYARRESRAPNANSAPQIPHHALRAPHSKAPHFNYGASGASTSPNTEVNAENQGVISEVTGTAQCKKEKKKL